MAGSEMDTGAGEPEKVAVEIVAADGVARTEEVHVEDVMVLEPGEMVKTPEGQPNIEAPAAVEIEPDVEAIAEAAAEKAVEKAGIASSETLDPPTLDVQESADPGEELRPTDAVRATRTTYKEAKDEKARLASEHTDMVGALAAITAKINDQDAVVTNAGRAHITALGSRKAADDVETASVKAEIGPGSE